MNPVALNTKDAADNPPPLWIIALFVTLSQVTAGAAAVATDGTTRLIFAIFAVSFPILVLVAFVCLLLFRPLNLYAPAQYTERTGIREYAEGLSRQDRNANLVYKQAITEALVAGVVAQHPAADDLVAQQAVRNLVAQRFEDIVDQNSVTLDRSLMLDGAEPVQIPVTHETTVDEFLDSVWFNISESVEPYTYNKAWILADSEFSPLQTIGTNWAKRQGWLGDERTLQEASIIPGQTYFALPRPRLPGVRAPSWTWRAQVRKLVTRYDSAIRSHGLKVRRIAGAQRPRLVVSDGIKEYGLYVMAGHAEASWVTQASEACSALAVDENTKITAVLALEREPRDRVRAAGDERDVYVIWLDDDGLHETPWDGREPAGGLEHLPGKYV
jgi:hypothetical protein